MIKHLVAIALLPICIAAVTPAPMTAARMLQESDYQKLVGLSSPAISPDGKRAVVVVSRISWNDDKRTSQLLLVDLATRAQRPLTFEREGVASPAWSPDGTRIAFLAKNGAGDKAKTQVFVMPLDGGDAHPITDAKDGVEQFAWRPDGNAIAYAAVDPKPMHKGADRFRDSFVFTTEPIVMRERPRPAHLYLIAASGGRAEQLTFGPRSVATSEAQSTLSWSPDGKTLAFTDTPNGILNDESYSRVALLDVAAKKIRYLTAHAAWETNALFSPDGKHVAYLYSDGDPQVNLVQAYVTSVQGGTGEPVSAPIDRAVNGIAWSRDSNGLYVTTDDDTAIALFSVSMGGRQPHRVAMGDLCVQSPLDGAVASNGAMVFVATSTKQPPELFYRSPAGKTEKLTDLNGDIARLDLASSERITYPTSLGMNGDAVLFTPPTFVSGRRYPMVVYIHGGPTGASVRGFDFWAQAMAARGWLVLRPNYRGSDNLGVRYQRAVLYDPDEGPGKDIMAAVDAVRSRGVVDDRRIAVSGWSYGGIMTAWMISRYHIWSSAVSGASVDDWFTDYGTADDSLADVDLFHGSPYVGDNAPEWRKASAISYVKDVTTPVLILSDVGDNRDPFATSSMYWRALRDNHKDATLRVWPIDGHFPHDPVRVADVYHYWIDYIAQHFK